MLFRSTVIVTLACFGLLSHVIGSTLLFLIVWLLLISRAELTQPIPRSEWRSTFITIGILLAVLLTLPFLRLPAAHKAVADGMGHPVIVAALWLLWMWGIYCRWQREKRKVE